MEKELSFFEKINFIQSELKAPKNQFNSFGNYSYRSCEDILEAVKPLMIKVGLVLTIEDDVILVGDRFYIKATATIGDGENTISNSAMAREADQKRGMDSAQVTGATSSYARKYALNGLFCIDDTKDADSNEHKQQQDKYKDKQSNQPSDYKAKHEAIKTISEIAGKKTSGKSLQEKAEFMHRYMGVTNFDELKKFDLTQLNKIIGLMK